MRTKVTLVLLLLNVALLFYIVYFERPARTEINSHLVLQPATVDAASRLEIRRADGPTIALEKRNDVWTLTAPYAWPANRSAVDRILNELLLLKDETKFEVATLASAGQKLADYGLDPAALTLVVDGPAGRTELRIGAVTHVQNRLYVLSPSGKYVHVVGRGLADKLQLPAAQWRDDTLFDIPVFEARSLVVALAASPSTRVRIVKSGTRWLFESPIQTRADRTVVELTLNRLRDLRVAGFRDAAAADPRVTGLDNPAVRLTVEGNQRSVILLLGAPVAPAAPAATTAEYFARLDDRERPAVFTVVLENTLLDLLRNAQTELRDRHLLDLDESRLTAITLKTPGQPEVSLQRLEAGQWQVLARAGDEVPQPWPADAEVMRRLLDQLAQLRAEAFFKDVPLASDLEEWGFNRPTREVALALRPEAGAVAAAAPAASTLLVGSATEWQNRPCRYARLGSPQFVYLVRGNVLDDLPVEARFYRERTLRTLPAGARIAGLSLKQYSNSGDKVLFARQLAGDQTWETALAEDKPAVRAAVLQLRDELRTLRVRRFVRDHFANTVELDGQPQPWRYELEATIALPGAGEQAQTSTSKLFLGDRIGGATLYVGSAEFDTVFLATQPLLDAVFTLVLGDRDPGAPPDDAK